MHHARGERIKCGHVNAGCRVAGTASRVCPIKSLNEWCGYLVELSRLSQQRHADTWFTDSELKLRDGQFRLNDSALSYVDEWCPRYSLGVVVIAARCKYSGVLSDCAESTSQRFDVVKSLQLVVSDVDDSDLLVRRRRTLKCDLLKKVEKSDVLQKE